MKMYFKDENNKLRIITAESFEDMLLIVNDNKASKIYIKETTGITINGAILGLVKWLKIF